MFVRKIASSKKNLRSENGSETAADFTLGENFMKNAIKFLSLFGLLLAAITSFAVNAQAKSETEILIVADQKVKCGVTGGNECLQVKRLDEENFRLIFQNIERFNFVPGYFYVLEVQSPYIQNASTYGNKLRLIRVLARVKSEKKSPQKPADFFGTEWKLTRIEGKAVSSEKAFIRFDDEKKSAGGNGGCNVFGGDLEKKGSQIKISNVFSTKMYCESGSDIENKFFARLDRVNKYEIKAGKLFLMAKNKVLLEFKAKN
jgi:heat shock protein HslJ